jgi:type II secretory pathway component PulF
MLAAGQIPLTRLAELCRRVGFSLQAGVAARRTWTSEAERSEGAERERLLEVSAAIGDGISLAAALAGSDGVGRVATDKQRDAGRAGSPSYDDEGDGYFPRLVIDMVDVGEQSGHVDAVFLQLADHYEHLAALRAQFLTGLIWPAMQLAIAAAVVGLLIYISGMLPIDFLGLGLRGATGLAIYGAILLVVGSLGLVLWQAMEQGWWGAGGLMHLIMRLPYLGACLEAMAMARLCWSLAMAHEAGMTARSTAAAALRATENRYYSQHASTIDDILREGRSFTEAFAAPGVFPVRFRDTLAAAEEAGRITESLTRLADQYRDDARHLSQALTIAAGWLCGLVVSGLLVMLILRLGMAYVGQIKGLLDDMNRR